MPDIDRTFAWRPIGGYDPTAPFSGDASNIIYRGQNMILKGTADSGVYLENWRGITAFTESVTPDPVVCTGSVAIVAGSNVLTGTGTKFTQELIPTQWIIVDNDIWNVYQINSDEQLIISGRFTQTLSGLGAYRTQVS